MSLISRRKLEGWLQDWLGMSSTKSESSPWKVEVEPKLGSVILFVPKQKTYGSNFKSYHRFEQVLLVIPLVSNQIWGDFSRLTHTNLAMLDATFVCRKGQNHGELPARFIASHAAWNHIRSSPICWWLKTTCPLMCCFCCW
jgi:hypothetical protein